MKRRNIRTYISGFDGVPSHNIVLLGFSIDMMHMNFTIQLHTDGMK